MKSNIADMIYLALLYYAVLIVLTSGCLLFFIYLKFRINKDGYNVFLLILVTVISSLIIRFSMHYLGWKNYYPSLQFPMYISLQFFNNALIPLFFITAEETGKFRYSRILIFISAAVSITAFILSVSGITILSSVMYLGAFAYLTVRTIRTRNDKNGKFFLPVGRLMIVCFCFFPLVIIDVLKNVSFLYVFFPSLIQDCDFYPLFIIALCFLFALYSSREYKTVTTAINKEAVVRSFQELKNEFSLTFREYEVLKLMISGISNQKIETELYISSSTVKKHINSIYHKLDIKTRWELLHYSSIYMNSEKNSTEVL